MPSKPSSKLTLHDRLSRLTPIQAEKLLGPEGRKLMMEGSRNFQLDIVSDVKLTTKRLRVHFPKATEKKRNAEVVIDLSDHKQQRLQINCTPCQRAEIMKGAVLDLVLNEKLALGLSIEAEESIPWELLDEPELIEHAIQQRQKRANEEKMQIKSLDPETPWADYQIYNKQSGKTYRAALRGFAPGEAYCACRDFKTNRLGTCKHLIKLEKYVTRKFTVAKRAEPYRQSEYAVSLEYAEAVRPRLLIPDDAKLPKALRHRIDAFHAADLGDAANLSRLIDILRTLEVSENSVRIYPDAEDWIQAALIRRNLEEKASAILRNPAKDPIRESLLNASLLPYQVEGIAFAAKACRSINADEMGLGKTIQGIGLAAYLKKEANISKVLVICPASLKAQWKIEIERFSDLSAQLILGAASDRSEQYRNDAFITICNYEQVLKDILSVEACPWDLIILDEGQRIKNWEAKTSRVIKGLNSPYALVLTGTPLENRLDELFSVVEFIDDRRLGPAYRFFNQHRMVDEKGKVLGFQKLDELRQRIAPVLLRRTRDSVLKQLPPRTTQVVRITPTDEQLELHSHHMQTVSTITNKSHFTEMDFIRLQKALLMCRLAANSTFLVDKQAPGHSTKLEKLHELIDQLSGEPDRKVILFSEWTRMLDLVAEKLEAVGVGYVRLDGKVPQKKRQQIVKQFQTDPACRFIIMTNAGSTGLNLQAADTVINVDLPWNPAILEQRIARAHRMGQKRPVQVYILVTEGTIEENLLTTLSAKKELAIAALDMDSEATSVTLESGIEELKRRLEVLLGATPDAPIDETQRAETEKALIARKAELAVSGGQLLSAAFAFLGNLLPETKEAAESPQAAALRAQFSQGLSECITRDAQGRPTLQLTLPDDASIEQLAANFAKFAALAKAPPAP
jgi:superfamily II DNA or RNA helicase